MNVLPMNLAQARCSRASCIDCPVMMEADLRQDNSEMLRRYPWVGTLASDTFQSN